jgi:hypothetical protein
MKKVLKLSQGKRFIYRYNGDSNTEQIVDDPRGTMVSHLVGGIVNWNGKRWKVAVVEEELDLKGPFAVPIHHVYLTDAA